MDGTSAISTVSSVLTTTVKIAEKIFEICAVDEEARNLLKTVDQVTTQLNNAKTLRRQKSSQFTRLEKVMFDTTFEDTEAALLAVAKLAEGARVDMEVSGGRVRAPTRLLFVLRNSPRIQVALTRLGIANQNMNTHLGTLCSRQALYMNDYAGPHQGRGELRPPPPTYDEALFLSEGRRSNRKKRAAISSTVHNNSSSLSLDMPPSDVAYELEGSEVCDGFYASEASSTVSLLRPDDRSQRSVQQLQSSPMYSGIGPPTSSQWQRRRSGRERTRMWMEDRCL